MTDSLSAAMSALPHGPEFRFIDRLTHLEPGVRCSGQYGVRGDEPFLRGHFPGLPLFPGVLLIEAAAQLAGIVAQSDPTRAPLSGLKLTAVRAAKILGSASPGQTIELDAEVSARLDNLVHARVNARVNGVVILQTDLVLSGEKT